MPALFLYIEEEVHYVAVADDIILALNPHLAGSPDGGLSLIVHIVIVFDDLGADETPLEIRVDHTGRLGSLVALAYGPRTALVSSGREEGLQAEEAIGALDEADHSRLFKSELFEEHLPVVVVLNLRDVRLCPGGYHEYLGLLVLHGLTHSVDIFIAAGGGSLIHIADIHHWLVREQHKLARHRCLILIHGDDRAAGFALQQGLAVFLKQVRHLLRILVRSYSGLFGDLGESCLHSLEVLDLKLRIDYFLVADGIHTAVHVYDISILKTPEHVQYRVCLADIGEELVSETLTLAGTLDESGDIDYIHSRRDGALGLTELRKGLQALVRDVGGAEVGFYGAEREIGALSFSRADTVEECGLSHIWKSDYTAF